MKLAVVAGNELALDVVEVVAVDVPAIELVVLGAVAALAVPPPVPLEIVVVDGEQAVNSAVSAIRAVCC